MTYIYYKLKDRKIYRIALPGVLLHRTNSTTTAEEEEVLLLEAHQKEEDWTDTRPSNGDNDTPEPNTTTL